MFEGQYIHIHFIDLERNFSGNIGHLKYSRMVQYQHDTINNAIINKL